MTLREEIEAVVFSASTKAQIDYFAVNSPDGIRYGQTSETLADFLSAEIDNLEALIQQHTNSVLEDKAKLVAQIADSVDGLRTKNNTGSVDYTLFLINQLQVNNKKGDR